MKPIRSIAVATLLLSSFTVHAENDAGSAFKSLFSAIARVAEQQAQLNESQQGYYEDGYQQVGYYEQGPMIHNISGSWGMSSGGVNRFQKTYDGYYVIPLGRGKGVHYVEIGENLYQDASSSGTYEVIDRDYMVWRSNDKRNLVIELFRQ